ncbi:MAG: enoyl-ACP reductase [Pseudomonadota bacterium]|nr:enoyl-ACP reductase [Pseudomonadota bacterium]
MLLKGKRGLIMGVANERSLAWGIAKQAHEQGAELAFTFAGEALERRVKPLADSVGSSVVLPCDVTSDADIARTFADLEKEWGKLDFVVHAIAFSDKNELQGRYTDTSRENFKNTMDISCYSLVAVTKAAEPLLKDGGSVLTLSYYGAEKVIANYNVMGVAKAALEASVRYLAADLGQNGIRVNALSAGPIKTLASSGVGGLKGIMGAYEEMAPLRRNVDQEDVGKNGVYLISDLSSGVTGETLYVDSGVNIMGYQPKAS